MTKLKGMPPKEAKQRKPKMLIFGVAGIGKTFNSLDFPNVYYIDTEGGATLSNYTDKLANSGGVYLGIDQGSNDFKTILEQIDALTTEKHSFKTLVIDSITKVFNDEIATEAERLEKANKKNEFGTDKKPAVNFMKRLVNKLNKLDMNVIVVCHEKSKWVKGEQEGFTYDCWDKLGHELDLVMQIIKQGNSRKAKVVKSRYECFNDGDTIDWSYPNFAELYGKDIIEQESKPLELATTEQLEQLGKIIDVVKPPQEQIDKFFKKAKCDSWQGMEKDLMQKCIEYFLKQTESLK